MDMAAGYRGLVVMAIPSLAGMHSILGGRCWRDGIFSVGWIGLKRGGGDRVGTRNGAAVSAAPLACLD
jgi:hypothetical protein